MLEWIIDASAWVLPVVLAITLHEAAHGFVAFVFGDDTAKRKGRLSINPIRHIDRVGTIILPAILLVLRSTVVFGYAKPVPVDFKRLRPARLGMFMVAIAGVSVNAALAFGAGLALNAEIWFTPEEAPWIYMNLYRALMLNCVLIVFNMIPILPLDGGRAVDALLPAVLRKFYRKLEPIGLPIVFLTLLVPPLLGYNLMEQIVGAPAYWMVDQVLHLTQ